MLRFLLGISFCITLSACQTETLVKDVNISKKQELHNMNMNTYFAKNTKKLDEVIQIPSEGVKSIDVYALYGFVESFSPISTAEQIKQRVGEGLGYKDLFSKIIKNDERFLILLDSKGLKELFNTIDPNQNILK